VSMSNHDHGEARMPDTTRQQYLDEPLFGSLRRDLTRLLPDQTVGEALAFLRVQSLGERIVYFYVVDAGGKLVGVVPTRRLLMADPGTPVADVMVRDVLALPTSATVRDASEMFLKHRLLALPVVDAAGQLHGVADVAMLTGELADLTARQSAEDIFQLIGANASQPSSAWRGFLDRFPWLLCNIGGGLIAALIAGWYESLLDAVIVLALFIPVVLAVSESIAMQSVTLTLQSLHGTRADLRFLLKALRRELVTAVLLGAGCGAVVGAVVWGWKGQPLVAAVVMLTVTMAMATAALFGVALPGALRAMRRDPRIASGPIVLALTDFVALIFYFNVARWLLE
jgi:magnesium transporter